MTTKPVSFNINSQKNILYYNSKDLFNYDNLFYYGCKSKPRNIIVKKNIPETDYLFANQKLNEWNISTASCKKAQLLISKKWVDRFFFKIPQEPIIDIKPVDMTESNIIQHETTFDDIVLDEVKDDKDNLEYAPELINLKDNQKFRDSDGNIIEIETRGVRKDDNIYFKVSDVSKGFDMKNLSSILCHKDRGYIRNEDYKTFLIRVSNKGHDDTIKKSLYLTYNGLLKVINVSRNKFIINNANIITKWTNNIINNNNNNNYILLNINPDLSGFIYICSSPLINCVKIGYWTGKISGLESRYKMVYGKELFLNIKKVKNVYDIEKDIHSNFQQFNISGELFQKDKLQLYIDYLNNINEYNNINIKETYDKLGEYIRK